MKKTWRNTNGKKWKDIVLRNEKIEKMRNVVENGKNEKQ